MYGSRLLSRRWLFGSLALSLIVGSVFLHAAPPAWWAEGNPPVIDPQAESNNHGVANVGQAKHMAKEALAALRTVQPDAANAIEQELVGEGKPLSSWDSPSTEEQRLQQYQPLLIGQLKAISAPFYSKLHEIAPEWLEQQLTENQTKDGSDSQNYFPWTLEASDDSNQSPATIGQLKAVFSLRYEDLVIDEDQDEDGLPDAWEIKHGIDPGDDGSANPANGWGGDFDNDGVSNGDELQGDGEPDDPEDFPVRVIQVTKSAYGWSNYTANEPPREPYLGWKEWSQWWTGVGLQGAVIDDAAATPAYLDPIVQGMAFPATPPTSLPQIWQFNLSRPGPLHSHCRVNRPPEGNGIESGLSSTRVWIKAPAAPVARTFSFVKARDYTAYVHTTASNPTHTHTTTFVSADVVTATIPASETISNPIDLKYLGPIIDGCDVIAYEWLSSPTLLDVQDVGNADDRVIETLLARGPNESPNDYVQRALPNRHVAFIEPHRGTNHSPDMPRLVALLPGGPEVLKVKWRLEVDYERGNGWRAPYILDWRNPEDRVRIPAAAQDGTPTFTAEMSANQEWRIFETQDWQNEIQQRGFFGGTAKLYFWVTSQPMPTEPVITFRIGGHNPEALRAKAFIQQVANETDSRLWFAYAIAKEESHDYGGPDHEFYNQFFADYRRRSGNGWDTNMDWQCWAKAWPAYNLDRDSRDGPQNGPGGYGIFQVTGNATNENAIIPRRQIWNWQDNVRAGLTLIRAKTQWVDARYNSLQQSYASSGTIPNYPQNTASNHRRLSGWDAYVCTAYNGLDMGPDSQIERVSIQGFRGGQRTCWKPLTGGWRFLHNSNRYCERIFEFIEDNQ